MKAARCISSLPKLCLNPKRVGRGTLFPSICGAGGFHGVSGAWLCPCTREGRLPISTLISGQQVLWHTMVSVMNLQCSQLDAVRVRWSKCTVRAPMAAPCCSERRHLILQQYRARAPYRPGNQKGSRLWRAGSWRSGPGPTRWHGFCGERHVASPLKWRSSSGDF